MVELKGALEPRAVAEVSSLQRKGGDGACWWLVGDNWGARPSSPLLVLGEDRALGVHRNGEEGHPGPPLTSEQRVQEPGGEALG